MVEIQNLAIVQENKEAIAIECGDGFVKLLLPIQHRPLSGSVENTLPFLVPVLRFVALRITR